MFSLLPALFPDTELTKDQLFVQYDKLKSSLSLWLRLFIISKLEKILNKRKPTSGTCNRNTRLWFWLQVSDFIWPLPPILCLHIPDFPSGFCGRVSAFDSLSLLIFEFLNLSEFILGLIFHQLCTSSSLSVCPFLMLYLHKCDRSRGTCRCVLERLTGKNRAKI